MKRLGLAAALLLPACGTDGDSAGPTDTLAPTVSSTSPADAAAGVAINGALLAVFSEPMNPASLTGASFTLSGPGGSVAGSVAATGSSATFTPDADLAGSTTYTATLTTAVKDPAGNALAAPHVWTFTTGAAPDTTPPTVLYTVPAAGATHAHPLYPIEVKFSEAMDPATLGATALTLETAGGAPVAGSISKVATVINFHPSTRLTMGASYTARLSGAVEDLAGNPLGADLSWSFTVTPAWHVDSPGRGDQTGESWANAMAGPAFLIGYYEAGDEFRYADGPQIGLQDYYCLPGMIFRGGYAGDGAPDPEARTPGATVLQSAVIEPIDDLTWDGFTFENRYSFANGSAFRIDGRTGILIENCTFRNNLAEYGGAVWINFSSVTLRGCVFQGNEATYAGGAMKIFGGTVLIDRCRFTANKAAIAAGAVECTGAVTIVNSIVDGNRCPKGPGLWFAAPNGKVIHCTITGNRGDYAVSMISGGGAQVLHSIVWGNTSNDVHSSITAVNSHVGGVSPVFVANGAWDTLGTPSLSDDVWIPGDYHLQVSSPDRNTYSPDPGDPLEDYDALPRPDVVASDRGAFEYR